MPNRIKVQIIPKPGTSSPEEQVKNLHHALAPMFAHVERDMNSPHTVVFVRRGGGYTVLYKSWTNERAMTTLIEHYGFTIDPASRTEAKPIQSIPSALGAVPVAA